MAPPHAEPVAPRHSAKSLVGAVAYVAYLAFAIEFGLRLALLAPGFERALRVNDDASWRRAWRARHARAGSEITYRFDRFDERLGWRSQPGLRDTVAFHAPLTTNALGFRGPMPRADGERTGVRIAVLGDSFTFGDEVGDEVAWPAQLAQVAAGTEVLNFGVHGYGHDQMLLLLRSDVLPTRPEVVLLGFVAPDLARNTLAFRDFAKPRFRLAGDSLELEGPPLPTPEAVRRWDWLRPRTLEVLGSLAQRLRPAADVAREEEAIGSALLLAMARAVAAAGATPVFAYLPVRSDLARAGPSPAEAVLERTCQREPALRCLSLRPAFAGGQVDSLFLPSGHYRQQGHAVVARALSVELSRLGVVPPARR